MTGRISGFFTLSGLYDGVRRLNEELLHYEEHPLPISWIGRAYFDQSEYDEARKKFETALKIVQQIGDRAGEAGTFAQLGIMASERGHVEEGLRLVALSAMILSSIGHARIKEVEPWVNGLASQLNYTQEQFDSMLREVAESRQRDRSWSLIEAAFGED